MIKEEVLDLKGVSLLGRRYSLTPYKGSDP
jgi:hypothetical protein